MITRWLAFALAGGVALIDHGTKAAARAILAAGPVELTPFLDLRLGFNTGVSFGLFAGGAETTRWILIAATSLVAAWLCLWMARERRAALAYALGLIVGGALGNIVDRAWRGAVTDFIDLHVGALSWPAFNVADTAIVSGVALVLLLTLRRTQGATQRSRTNGRSVGWKA